MFLSFYLRFPRVTAGEAGAVCLPPSLCQRGWGGGAGRERQKLKVSLPVGEPGPRLRKVPAWEHRAGESPDAQHHKPGGMFLVFLEISQG